MSAQLNNITWTAFHDELTKIAGLAHALAEPLSHPIEVGGLGVLALPSIDNMVARHRARKELGLASGEHVPEEAIEKKRFIKERFHDPIEAGGLGALALPSIGHMLMKKGSVELSKHGTRWSSYVRQGGADIPKELADVVRRASTHGLERSLAKPAAGKAGERLKELVRTEHGLRTRAAERIKKGSAEKDAGPVWDFLRGKGTQTAKKVVQGRTPHWSPAAGLATAAQQGGAAYREAARKSALAMQRRGDLLAAGIGGL
jgi:hypothetical protein